MSIENVNQFYQVVLQDSALQQKFQFTPDEESLVKMAVELGQQQGYDFTSEEAKQALTLATPSTTGMVELADEQLEAVAGGKQDVRAVAVGAATGGLAGFVTSLSAADQGNVEFVKQTQADRSGGISL